MQEIELKCQIPVHALVHIQDSLRALPGGERPPQRLLAAYFDTPERHLAQARAALRVRREDQDWVQTLKAAGANAMTRLEDNRPYPPRAEGDTSPLWPDLSLHSESARLALVRDLGWQPDHDTTGRHCQLVALYRTDMHRMRAQQTVRDTQGRTLGTVELALDLGEIVSGELRRPVRELEIELIEGHAVAVIEAMRQWVSAHGLWLDAQTKAHRGDQLAREAADGQPSPSAPARPRTQLKDETVGSMRAWKKAWDTAFEQAHLNQSEVALGHADHTAWVRAWVIGLRRLQWLAAHPATEGHTEPVPSDGRTPTGSHFGARRISTPLSELIRQLRPGPRQWAAPQAASELARHRDTSLLMLDLLACLFDA